MVKTGYVDKIPALDGGSIAVVHNPQGADFGPVDLNSPPKGVLHTTEGSNEPPAYGSSSPHFTVGSRIFQHRPLGRMAGALRNESGGIETNRLVRVQIELVEFSEIQPWLPDSDAKTRNLAALLEFCQAECGIPEDHVFPDDATAMPLPWAVTTNARRRSGKFPGQAGWYYHLEVPENSHWDCGSLLSRKLLSKEPGPIVSPAYAVFVSYTTTHAGDTHRHSKRLTDWYRTAVKASAAGAARSRAVARAMRGKVYSEEHGGLIDAKKVRLHVVKKRIRDDRIKG